MSACARIGCAGGGGSYSLHCGEPDVRPMNAWPRSVVSVTGPRNGRCSSVRKISISMAEMAPASHLKLERRSICNGEKGGNGSNGEIVSREKLDEWMRDSVVEIVKNLREAPLLVHVHAKSNGTVRTTTMKKAEDWQLVKGRWKRGEEQLPEGMIFVEQLEDDEDDVSDQDPVRDHGGDEEVSNCGSGGATRAWGIVAQGRGLDSGPVCYLLKTSRVGSGIGTGSGMWCTHFSLVKVRNFRETTKSQLKNSWLSQAGQ